MHLSPAQIGVLIWLAVCLPALAWGGRPERIIAVVLLADLASVFLFPGLSPGESVHWVTLAGDVIVLLALVAMQVRWPRRWLLVAIGFQIIAVLVHVPRIIDPGIHRWAYAAAITFSGYAVVLALAAGTVLHLLNGRSVLHARQRHS